MAKPIINQVSPFDADSDYDITFSWSGNMAYGNRIIVQNAVSLATVYDATVTSFKLLHTIPARTLTNGVKYVAQIQVFDSDGTASVLSDKALFLCLETPTFQFADLNDGDTIGNASYTATITYSQSNWEDIKSYKFYLYDVAKNVLVESDEMYDLLDMSYVYRGLDTSTNYYVRCIGVTINGLDLDTGYINIYVYYKNPSSYASIYVENVAEGGYIKYNTNIVVIQYNGDETFEYDSGKIDLTDKTLMYDDGFKISGDFTLKIKGYDMWRDAEILKCHNDDLDEFTLTSMIYEESVLRYKLTVPNGICNYIIYSEPLQFEWQDMITIVIRRINNVYQIYTFINLGEAEEEDVDTYFSDTRPMTAAMYDYWIENGETEITKIAYEDKVVFVDETEPTDAVDGNLWIGGGN